MTRARLRSAVQNELRSAVDSAAKSMAGMARACRQAADSRECHFGHVPTLPLFLRPEDALLCFRHWGETLVNELLHALASSRFGGVEIAPRISDDAMHGIELTGLPS